MRKIFHITSGDIAGDIIKKSGIAGEVFVWHDILYAGPGLHKRSPAAFAIIASGGRHQTSSFRGADFRIVRPGLRI